MILSVSWQLATVLPSSLVQVPTMPVPETRILLKPVGEPTTWRGGVVTDVARGRRTGGCGEGVPGDERPEAGIDTAQCTVELARDGGGLEPAPVGVDGTAPTGRAGERVVRVGHGVLGVHREPAALGPHLRALEDGLLFGSVGRVRSLEGVV